MTSKLTRLTDDELTETLRLATSGYPLPASVEGNLRHAFAELQERRKAAMDSKPVAYMTYKGYLLHAGDQKLAEYSEPMPLYADPRPASTPASPVAWDYEWASCITCEGPQNFNRVIEREAPPEWAVDEGQARNIIPLYRHAQPAKGLELAGWQFKSVNGDWLGLIDEHRKNQAVREGCEVREVFAMADGVNDRDQVRSEHAEWSQTTFGNVGPIGPLKHLSKEALEAAAEPGDLSEWADMQFLLWDAQRRAGITDEQITLAMIEKLAVNKLREWPEPKDGEPRLHIKEKPAQVVPNGLRLALSNAGIAAPESDEMLAATCEKHIQALVTWVKDRKPFQSAPVVPSFEEWLSAANRKPLGWVKDAMREASDACRAAMLQAGNSPVIPDGSASMLRRWLVFGRGMQNAGSQLPHNLIAETEEMLAAADCSIPMISDRWIPVSERMPEKNGTYQVWNGEHVGAVPFLFGSFQCLNPEQVTHWMPTARPPLEMKP